MAYVYTMANGLSAKDLILGLDTEKPTARKTKMTKHHVALFDGKIIGEASTEAEALSMAGATESHNIDFYDAEDGPGVQGYEADGMGVWIIDPVLV